MSNFMFKVEMMILNVTCLTKLQLLLNGQEQNEIWLLCIEG